MTTKSTSSSSNDKNAYSSLAQRFMWADSPEKVSKLIRGLSILCGLLFILDLILHRHSYVPGEGLPGFYAFVGFIAFTVIVLGATQLRKLILRSEDYYAPNSVDAESYPAEGLKKLEHEAMDAPVTNKAGHKVVTGEDS